MHFPQVPSLVKEPSQKVLPDSGVIPKPLYPTVLTSHRLNQKLGQSWGGLSRRLETHRAETAIQWSRGERERGDRPAIPDSGQTRDLGTAVVIWGCRAEVKIGPHALQPGQVCHDPHPLDPKHHYCPIRRHAVQPHMLLQLLSSQLPLCAHMCFCMCADQVSSHSPLMEPRSCWYARRSPVLIFTTLTSTSKVHSAFF